METFLIKIIWSRLVIYSWRGEEKSWRKSIDKPYKISKTLNHTGSGEDRFALPLDNEYFTLLLENRFLLSLYPYRFPRISPLISHFFSLPHTLWLPGFPRWRQYESLQWYFTPALSEHVLMEYLRRSFLFQTLYRRADSLWTGSRSRFSY